MKGFTKTFPYNTGTFVIVDEDDIDINNPETLRGRLGTISCYQCVTNREEYVVMVSGYKDAWGWRISIKRNSTGNRFGS